MIIVPYATSEKFYATSMFHNLDFYNSITNWDSGYFSDQMINVLDQCSYVNVEVCCDHCQAKCHWALLKALL